MAAPPTLRKTICACSKGLSYDLEDLLAEIDRQAAALKRLAAERDAATQWAIAALARCADLSAELGQAIPLPGASPE